jgi:hypothetical protein
VTSAIRRPVIYCPNASRAFRLITETWCDVIRPAKDLCPSGMSTEQNRHTRSSRSVVLNGGSQAPIQSARFSTPHDLALLRLRDEGPRCHATEQRDELARNARKFIHQAASRAHRAAGLSKGRRHTPTLEQ